MSRSLSGIYYGYSSRLIMLKRSPQCGSIILDLVLSSVSLKAKGWEKSFFVNVLMIGSTLGVYSNCLMVSGDKPSPVLASFSLGTLGEHLVVGFLGGIFPTSRA
jgi:hypothetical protein